MVLTHIPLRKPNNELAAVKVCKYTGQAVKNECPEHGGVWCLGTYWSQTWLSKMSPYTLVALWKDWRKAALTRVKSTPTR